MAEGEAASITIAAPTITKKKHQTPKQPHRAALDTWASESPAHGYKFRHHELAAVSMPSVPTAAVVATTTTTPTTDEVAEGQLITAARQEFAPAGVVAKEDARTAAEREEAVLLRELPAPTHAIAPASVPPGVAARDTLFEVPSSAPAIGTAEMAVRGATAAEADKNDAATTAATIPKTKHHQAPPKQLHRAALGDRASSAPLPQRLVSTLLEAMPLGADGSVVGLLSRGASCAVAIAAWGVVVGLGLLGTGGRPGRFVARI